MNSNPLEKEDVQGGRKVETIEEGKLSDAAARVVSLAIKKKVINKGREVRAAQDLQQKIDLLSQQVSALAALTLVGI